jgi:hypothetical protein
MNYYWTEREDKTLYHLTDGSAVYEDELAAAKAQGREQVMEDGKAMTHTETQRQIKWAKITGSEVLEKTDWPGHWIPIMKVVGEELQPYDQERRCEGVVRPMRGACKGNNYIISKFVERVGLTPIAPIVMAGGQDEGYEAEWDAVNTRTLSRLHYNQKDQFGMPVPTPPFRPEARAEIADIGMGVQIFGQAIQATSVMPETALGQVDPTVKSGKMAQALIEQGERGTSNFMDNLVRSLRHEARVINDLLYPIYGRQGRLARMMNGQGEMSSVLIDQPFVLQGEGAAAKPVPVQQGQPMPGQPQGQPPVAPKVYKLTKDANFNVAVKVSKSIDTRRQQIAEFLGNFVGADPQQMAIIGDKLWKYIDLPDHAEIAERYKVMLAPQIQKLLSEKDGPSAEELQAELEKAGQMMSAMSKQLEGLTQTIETDQIKAEKELQKTQIQQQSEDMRAAAEIQSKERIEMRKLEVELEIEMAKLGSAQAMKRAELEQNELHQHSEALQRQEETETAAQQADMDRQHERDMADTAAAAKDTETV